MKIVCFGSLNIDHVYQVEEIVKPGMTINALDYSRNCGGKGLNQSVAISKAGGNISHAGAIGMDGTMLLRFLNDCGIDAHNIVVTDTATGHAIIQVNKQGENSIIVLAGANHKIDSKMVQKVLDEYETGDFIVLQNEISSLIQIINMAHEKGLKVCFTPSPITPVLKEIPFNKIDYLFINKLEGQMLTGKKEKMQILKSLREKYPECRVVLTLGKNGAAYAGPEGAYEQEIFATDAVDTTAAGDTFCGFFITAISKGKNVQHALRIASMASSICVSKAGAAKSIPTMEEVEIALENR